VLEDIVNRLPSNSPLANLALTVANDIMNAFDGTSASIPTCRKMAEKVLGQDWEQRTGAGGWKDHSGSLWGLGHCHIDTAW
jgi:alpha-mannosidase